MKIALRATLVCVVAAFVAGCSSQPAEIDGEQIPTNEAGATASALASLRSVARHPTYPGCVRANVTVDRRLPSGLRASIFSRARSYPAWVRFSSDSVGHSMAIEVDGVDGPRLIPDGARTQDFVMSDFPVYFAATVADYAPYASALARGTAGAYLAATPAIGRIVAATNGQTVDNLLTQRYFSMTPYRIGSTYVKFSARPAPCPIASHLGSADASDPSGLRAQIASDLGRGDACYELQLQPRTDPATMPIEDASALWDESKAPFVNAAFIDIPRQSFGSVTQQKFCTANLRFNPWHGTSGVLPVGGINRLSLAGYRAGIQRP